MTTRVVQPVSRSHRRVMRPSPGGRAGPRRRKSTRQVVPDRPEARQAAATTREANYSDEQRQRRLAQLAAIRPHAVEQYRRKTAVIGQDPQLARARLIAKSKADRKFRPGVECRDLRRLVLLRRRPRPGLPPAQSLQPNLRTRSPPAHRHAHPDATGRTHLAIANDPNQVRSRHLRPKARAAAADR